MDISKFKTATITSAVRVQALVIFPSNKGGCYRQESRDASWIRTCLPGGLCRASFLAGTIRDGLHTKCVLSVASRSLSLIRAYLYRRVVAVEPVRKENLPSVC
jgi:hypothetical protein